MVTNSYMLDKPRRPSDLRRAFDQQVLPLVIDALGGVEQVVEQLALRTRRQPTMVLGMAAGAGVLLSLLAVPRRRRRRGWRA